MPDLSHIYKSEAERYHALVSREDYQHNLLPAIMAIDSLIGKRVIELGAGTGRVSRLIAPLIDQLLAGDISHHMLAFAKKQLEGLPQMNWGLSLESHLALPFASDTADVILAGWSFCYAAIHIGENWRASLERALAEAKRVLKPVGKLILIESLGTGFERPHAPDVLVEYLDYLNTHGFESTWVRTDYYFNNKTEANQLTRFFFGVDPMPMQFTEAGVIVPECTGLWWKKF